MGSAKIIFKEADYSGYVPSISGIYGGMVHPAKKGRVEEVITTTSESNFNEIRGLPDPRLGSFAYSAYAFFTKSDKLQSVRVTHRNANSNSEGVFDRDNAELSSEVRYAGEARFSGALVRAITKEVDLVDTAAVFSTESMVVKPLDLGLVQDEFDAYNFPLYVGERTYEDTPVSVIVKYPVVNSKEIYVSSSANFEVGDLISVKIPGGTLDDNSVVYTVESKYTKDVNYETVTLDASATADAGASIRKVVDTLGVITYENYPDMPTLLIGASGTPEVIVSNSDFIANGDVIIFGTNTTDTYTVISKGLLPVTEQIVKVDMNTTIGTFDSIYKIAHYEIEHRDAFLVIADSQGLWGDTISVGIEASTNYSDGFTIVVYVNGVEEERFEDCARTYATDGFGNQRFLEDKINGQSSYIRVLNNELLDSTYVPKSTEYAYWRENPVDIFEDTSLTLLEDVVKGDFYIKASGVLPLGRRIRIGDYNDEYKVASILNGQIVLDRAFLQNKVSSGESIYEYDYTETKKISKLSASLPGIVIGATYNIGSLVGTLLDASANFTNGGDNGSSVTVYDLIRGAMLFEDKESVPVTLLMDGGFADPALAQKLTSIAEKRDDCFVYLSMDPLAESSANYITAMKNYRDSLNINSSYASLFHGWVKVSDPYNQTKVWAPPVGFAMAAQSYTASNFDMWYPAAGWTRGKLMALELRRAVNESERDILVDYQINPIRYKPGSGMTIWGNETLQSLPSALQSRHVRMMIIVIKEGLRAYLDGKHFDLNTERGRSMIEAAINAFMRDTIGDGVYDYTVSVTDYTTGTDIAQNKVRVFLGITPTMYMKEFIVNLGIFAANQKIEVI